MTPDRPTPLRDAVRAHGLSPAVVGGTLSALLAGGLVNRAQLDAVTGILGLSIIALALVVPLFTASRVVRAGEHDVTPTSDPQTSDGDPLVPLTGARLGDVLEQVLTGLEDLHAALPSRPQPYTAQEWEQAAPVTSTTALPVVRRSADPASTQLPPPRAGRHRHQGDDQR